MIYPDAIERRPRHSVSDVSGGQLGTPAELGTYCTLVGAFDVIYLVAGFLLFPKVFEESDTAMLRFVSSLQFHNAGRLDPRDRHPRARRVLRPVRRRGREWSAGDRWSGRT